MEDFSMQEHVLYLFYAVSVYKSWRQTYSTSQIVQIIRATGTRSDVPQDRNLIQYHQFQYNFTF